MMHLKKHPQEDAVGESLSLTVQEVVAEAHGQLD